MTPRELLFRLALAESPPEPPTKETKKEWVAMMLAMKHARQFYRAVYDRQNKERNNVEKRTDDS